MVSCNQVVLVVASIFLCGCCKIGDRPRDGDRNSCDYSLPTKDPRDTGRSGSAYSLATTNPNESVVNGRKKIDALLVRGMPPQEAMAVIHGKSLPATCGFFTWGVSGFEEVFTSEFLPEEAVSIYFSNSGGKPHVDQWRYFSNATYRALLGMPSTRATTEQ